MKRFISILLVFVLTLGFAPLFARSAEAATVLKNGEYVTISKNGYYVVSVPGEGYLVATLKCAGKYTSSEAIAEMQVLNAKKKVFTDSTIETDVYLLKSASGTLAHPTGRIPVSKGTYYIRILNREVENGGSVAVKYTFKAINQAANYSSSRALTLKKGEARGIYQTPANNYDRWFKFTLAKAGKVKFTGTNLDAYKLRLYNAEGKEFTLSATLVSPKLAKGTYFLLADRVRGLNNGKASYFNIKW